MKEWWDLVYQVRDSAVPLMKEQLKEQKQGLMRMCLHLQKVCLCSVGSELKERGDWELGLALLQVSRHRGGMVRPW